MKKLYKLTLAVALFVLGAFSANAQNTDIYVGGVQNDQAAIWKNEVPQIYDGWEINSIIKVDDDFYIAGLNKQGEPVIWKNDEILFTLSEYSFIAITLKWTFMYPKTIWLFKRRTPYSRMIIHVKGKLML